MRYLVDPFPRPEASLIDLLRTAAGDRDRGVRIYDRRGKTIVRKTWAEVVDLSARWATWARATGVRPGDHVMISLPTSFEFAAAWFGAVLLGARPLALALPRAMGGENAFQRRIRGLWDFLSPAWLVAEGWARETLEKSEVPEAAAGRVHEFPDLSGVEPLAAWAVPPAAGVAFLQLTSGSTAFPKAVRISHRAILANCRGIGLTGGGVVEEDVVVCWLPLNHDMGLVGLFLFALYWDRDLVLLRPETFLARPIRWLEAFSAFGGTITSAPDFAYRYAIEKTTPEERAGLDLSRWRVACTGAETVWESTLDRFGETFAPHGFRREAFIPCYGMAETTLAATFQLAGRGPRVSDFGPEVFPESKEGRTRRIVSVGRPLLEHRIEVRSPSGEALPDRVEGEIAVRGPCVFDGYHGEPERTAETLVDGWVRTGDLGVTDGGELYVTGRMKEILKVDGKAFAVQELEWVATEAIGASDVRACVFGVLEAGRECPVLVAEVPAEDEALLARWSADIHRNIARDFGTPLADLAFVRRGDIPRTTSGKMRRNELKSLYLEGKLDRVGPAAGRKADP